MKKVLIGLAVFILLLVGAVVAVPFLFKDKINAAVKEEINNQLNAKVDYGDFSLSLIRSFPNFSFSVQDLTVAGIDSFAGDTLMKVGSFGITVDIMSVLQSAKYKILALNVQQPVIHAIVSPDGKANWDITKPTPDNSTAVEPVNFTLEIKKYSIEDGYITYDDKADNTYAQIDDLDFEGSGNVTQDIYDLITKTSIAALTYRSGAVPYLSKAKLHADMSLAIDNLNSKYTFKENSLTLNDLALHFDGFVQSKKEEMNMDVKFKSDKTDFKSILSLIPAVYKKDFDKVKTSGTLALDGMVKGLYKDENYPSFNLNLKVNNGMFQYPDLPVAVKNIAIASNISKPQGDLDFTLIDVSKFHFDAGTDPFDARVKVKTPVSNPNVDASIAGKLNLANVPKFYPMEGLKTLSGLLNMNLNFSGKKSDIDAKNYAAIKAAGNARISNLVYDSKEVPMPVRVMDMQMTFNPQNVTLNSFSSAIGKSDFNANGTLDNFMAYAFGKGDLTGALNLRSSKFDANEWLSKDDTQANTSTAAGEAEYFKVPAHLDFVLNSQIGKILYEKIVLENVKGQILVKDEALNLNDLFANVFGGTANISARYNTKNLDHPDISFTYDIKNFDFKKTYEGVEMSEKLAPVIKYVQGNFSSDLKGEGKLNPDMSVDYNSLTGDGKVEIPYAKIVGLPILTKVTEVAKIPALQNLEMKNAWTVLKFKNGRVNVEPMDLKLGNGYNMNIQGSNGFDQTIDYDMRMDVPSSQLGGATTIANSMLSKVPGMGATMPDIVSFVFNVTGTTSKPQVKLSKVLAGGSGTAKDMAKDAVEDLKKKAEDELKKQTDAAKQKAEEELQKQRQAAEQKAKEATEKARKEAEKKAKEAADKAKEIFKFPR